MSDLDTCQHPDTVICRHCGQKRVKTFGKVGGDKRTVYVDEFGERWYGKKCPKCYKKYKVDYDTKRNAKKGYRTLGSVDSCTDCNARFIVRVWAGKRCPDCHQKHVKALREKGWEKDGECNSEYPERNRWED